MHQALKAMPLGSALVLGGVLASGLLGLADAQDVSRPTRSARGGVVVKSGGHQFEVFFYPTGLRAFAIDSAGTPLDASSLAGTATFYHPHSPRPWFSRPLHVAPVTAGHASPSLDLSVGLGTVPPTGAKVVFDVSGLPGPSGSTADFTVPFEFAKTSGDSSAAHPEPPPVAASTSPRFVYGPGYSGFGYYQYPGPEAAPAPASGSNPTVYSYGSPGSGHGGGSHDWSTGRDYQGGGLISKPWLRPTD